MSQPNNNVEPGGTAPASAPPMRSTDFFGQQPQFILRDEQAWDSAIRIGGHVHFLSMDHPIEPLYEIVAEPGNAEPAAVLAHLYDRDTDQLWQLRDVRSGRTVHSDLQLQGWSHAEEIAVSDPAEALRLADEFGRNAHESGIPPIPELDANYVTAVALWPQVAGEMQRDWLGSWFEASFHNPGVWEDVDWTTDLEGTRYAGMSADQALTAAATDLEVAIKTALPRHMLPTPDSVREFLHGNDIDGRELGLDSERDIVRGADVEQSMESTTALDAALGPLTPPSTPTQSSPPGVTHARPASELPRAALPHQQQDQTRRGH
ncbi:hypothetical protein [Nocardia vaccinii]|uniref:hypothetical protein n=1 Tax=Nocardia vaccinii TaxID=1822 RepID=UPI000AEEF1E2|nr:hypothetical protein [Nocardia vaccinii]